jgi:hypothetical protein
MLKEKTHFSQNFFNGFSESGVVSLGRCIILLPAQLIE